MYVTRPPNLLKDEMTENYFKHVRSDIEPLLPAAATRILDVGAGAGFTSAWLKTRFPGSYAVALEGNSAMKEPLARNVDEFRIVNLNDPNSRRRNCRSDPVPRRP